MPSINKTLGILLAGICIICWGCPLNSGNGGNPSPSSGGSSEAASGSGSSSLTKPFKEYWYGGQAELYKFRLRQARYGEHHKGIAVMVFVTEDFLTETQVKLEQPDKTDEKVTSVLKLNFIRRFTTGVYDYSLMNSVFTPVHQKKYPHSLKVTTSTQDWCGQNYLQINHRNKNYKIHSYSYFQKSGDKQYRVPVVHLEDELWTKLRMNPGQLPEGNIRMIPGTMYSRLMLKELAAKNAIATHQSYSGEFDYPGDSLMQYTINYPGLERHLKIVYEQNFPYRIAGWEESYASGFGDDPDIMTTRAVRDTVLRSDYWTRNAVRDSVLRQQMQMKGFR